MSVRGIGPVAVKEDRLGVFLDTYGVEAADRAEISETGAGSYIYFTLKARGEVDSYTLVEFAEICRRHRQVFKALQAVNNG